MEYKEATTTECVTSDFDTLKEQFTPKTKSGGIYNNMVWMLLGWKNIVSTFCGFGVQCPFKQ